MTVQNTTVKDIYVGNGATTKFPITFQMTDHPEYIKVYITGDDSVAVETKNFSVDLEAKTVTYPANGDPLPDGHKITIYRELPFYQLMNLVNQGPFFAENIELSFDDLTFICQQLNEKLNRTLSAGVDVNNFNNTFPVKAGMSFRINDAGDGLVLTEDPARVLPLAKDILEQTKQVKESAINETTNIKNTAIEELTAIKDAAVNETTSIKDEAVAAKNTAVEAATTAAEDAAQKTVENITAEIDSKVAAAEDSKKAAAQSASSAADSMAAAQTSKEAAAASANSASSSATTATEQADRAQDIADSLEGLAGITGIATTEEAIAGVVDNKAMTPLKTKEAINTQTQNKADLVNGKVPEEQLKALGIMTIPDNSDLNDYKNAGVYCCNADVNAATISNVAAPKAFYLEVLQMMEGYVKQVFSSYPINNPRVYIRMYYDGTWGSWKELGGTPIGDVIYRPYLLTGHVKANGATVSRFDYPTLEAFANEKNLWGNNVWQYGVGNGSTTMVLPNYLNRVLEGGDVPAVLNAGLPNITGNISFTGNSAAGGASGCFASAGYNQFWASGDRHDGIGINMDASRSNSIYGASHTVQPPAIVLIPQIKY